jgi:hypothetical protein
MRSFLIALLMVAGLSLAAATGASAAPASGMPIANALSQFDNTQAEPVACRRICNWRGCVTRCSGPAFVAPVAPLYVAPGPVCRSVRVCDFRGCFWRRRCY